MIDTLPRRGPEPTDRPEGAGADHPMRVVTRQVAFEPGGWTPERAAKVAELFDGLAAEWNQRVHATRMEPLVDALERGGLAGAGVCVEPGSGTGLATAVVAERFDVVVAVDIAAAMLARAPAALAPRVRADSAALPLRDSAADAVVLVNALLFPAEVDRVLAPGGAVVWVSLLGDRTPIYLPVDEVAAALPGRWEGVASECGWGSWGVLRRTGGR